MFVRLAGIWNLVAVAVEMFSHFVYLLRNVCKFCIFNEVCSDDAAVSSVTVQHTKAYFRQLYHAAIFVEISFNLFILK